MKSTTANRVVPTGAGFIDDTGRPIIGINAVMEGHTEVQSHAHPRAQLAYAAQGILRVSTEDGLWVVPSTQAVWIPGGVTHSVATRGGAQVMHLFVDSRCFAALPDQCSVLEVSVLLRELIVRALSYGMEYLPDSPAARLMAVIGDELQALRPSPLHLPLARDRRLLRIMGVLSDDPADGRGLDHWAERVGASERTLERLFRRETGMSFSQWRQRLRLQEAVKQLDAGAGVIEVAMALGYRSPSAFVAMFRKALGKPPRQYCRDENRRGEG